MSGGGHKANNSGSGSGGGGRRRGGQGAGQRRAGDSSVGQRRGHTGNKRGGAPNQTPPIEIAVRSSRNAIKRHADSLKDEQIRLACRSLLIALRGNMSGVSNPAEILGVLEQLQQVLHATRRDDSQLPVTLRAVVSFASDTPARQREVQELVRLMLRHLYALNADFIPRRARDDGRFRADSVLDVVDQVARIYLDDAAFERLQS